MFGRQVPTGRGGTKNCASGTLNQQRHPEHTFTWEPGQWLRGRVERIGGPDPPCHVATTTRSDRVDERANIWPTRCPNAIRSRTPTADRRLAADSTSITRPRRFNATAGLVQRPESCATSCRPRAPGRRNHRPDGLWTFDLAGLNLAHIRRSWVELGNMRTLRLGADGAAGQKYANALAARAGFLATQASVSPSTQAAPHRARIVVRRHPSLVLRLDSTSA